MAKRPTLTAGSGMPVADNQNSITAGPRGPVLMQDFHLSEKLAHQNRERIPERTVHAKGSGAYGTPTVTKDITKYTKAKALSQVGKKTEAFLRFSTVAGERGAADAERDVRGGSKHPDAFYEPNSFDGPVQDQKYREPPLKLSGDAADRYDHRTGNDDYRQPGDLFRLMTWDQKDQLFHNIKAAMDGVPLEIVKRQLVHFYEADPEYGIGVATRMGLTVSDLPSAVVAE